MAFKVITEEEWEKKLNDVKISKEDMNKLVMNYLVTVGYAEAAERFKIESGTEHLDLGTVAARMAAMSAAQHGNAKEAIEILNILDPEILDRNSQLFFRLQQQRLIELIRKEKREEALEFSQETLLQWAEKHGSFREEVEKTVTLLLFNTFEQGQCPFGELMSITRRLEIANEVNEATLTSQSQEKDPKILTLLKILVWAHNQLNGKVAYPQINFYS